MNKNLLIKNQLELYIRDAIKTYKEYPLYKCIQEEINQIDSINWLVNNEITGSNNYKQEKLDHLNKFLNDSELHEGIDNLMNSLLDYNTEEIQANIAHQFISNLKEISSTLSDDKKEFKLNLLFLENDYEPRACFCGFDDENYEFKLLSGKEYLEFDYKKELFNGVGNFDFSPLIAPFLKFEKDIGEEKANEIELLLTSMGSLEEIKRLFIINSYRGIHNTLDKIKGEIRNINIPMRDSVHVFGNEHDMEQFTIYVL